MTDARANSPTLLLIDGHSMAFRAFYALPADAMRTTANVATNAVYGFTSMLIRLLDSERPTHIAVAFDLPGGTFRTEELDSYKAGRAETPPDFEPQIAMIEDMLTAMRIPAVSKPGYEADDVIATLTTQGRDAGYRVLIVSGDRDTLQLVRESATVLYPIKGVSEVARMTPDAVKDKYGVLPEQYPELAALTGETADNLPGVPGVGPKTAAKWLNEYGSLEALVAGAESVRGKVGESLREHLDRVRLNRRLNHLVTDLDLGVTLDDLAVVGFDTDAVKRVATDLQFSGLRDRILAANPDEAAAEPATEPIELIEVATFSEFLTTSAQAAGPIGVAVLGDGHPAHSDAWAVGLSDGTHVIGLELADLTPEEEGQLATFLAGETPKALHNAKEALHMLRSRGLALAGVTMDTELAAYLSWPDRRGYDLEDLAEQLLGVQLRSEGPQATLDLDGSGVAQEASSRAQAIAVLAPRLSDEVADRDGTWLLEQVEIPLTFVLADLEAAGIAVDADYLADLEKKFAAQVEEAAQAAYAAIDRTVNLGSPKQLQEVLFDQLGMPKTKKTKTGFTTDAAALAWLYEQTEHPFLQHLLAHRDATKMRTTVEGLIRSIADDGRIHTTYQQSIAATGRLSSTDPNLQNIPNRTEVGRAIRRGFVVGTGYEELLSVDYSQIEMRIMAHLSGDAELIAAFKSGEDLHRYVASRVYGIEPDDVSADQRSQIKAMTFGLAYGLSEFGLSQQLGISRAEAAGLRDDYFARFGKVRDYLQSVVQEAKQTGYTTTIFGRRRYLPDLTSTNRQLRDNAERVALNSPIQGSAADIIKIAMVNLHAALAEAGLSSRMLLQVHDELVVEVAPGESAEVTALLKKVMGEAADIDVPLDVAVGAGKDWLEAAH